MKTKSALLVFFHGKSNAGGTERVVQYLEEYLISKGIKTEIIDETRLLNTIFGKWFQKIFNYDHFAKRKPIYMARLASAYLWWRKRSNRVMFTNGETAPFYPVDFVMNHGCYHKMELDYGWPASSMTRVANLQRLGCKYGKEIVTVAEKVKQDLIKYYDIPASKIEVVSNPVNSTYFKPLPKEESSIKTVAYIGRLEPGKGLKDVELLAGIIERTEGWRLLIACNNVYNTDLFSSYKHTTIKIGLTIDNINEEAYSKADLIFYPSHSESFGMITIEALSAGVPIIATGVGIIPELLKRSFPGVHLLPKFNDEGILKCFSDIIEKFAVTVDRQALHKLVEMEFGIPGFRERLDEVIGRRL